MSYQLSADADQSQIFTVNFSEVAGGRLDPFYYVPSIVDLERRVSKVASHRLRDFVVRMNGGATPSTQEPEKHYSEDADIPFVRVQNLSTTGKLNLEDVRKISRETHETLLLRSQLSGGELLVKITGVGRMAVASVVSDGFEGNINQHLVSIQTGSKRTSEILAAHLNLDVTERLASRRATGGTRPALDYPALLSLPIIFDERIPDLIQVAIEKYEAQRAQAQTQLAQIDAILLRELGLTPPVDVPDSIENRIFIRQFSEVTGGRFDPLYFQEDLFACVRDVECPLNCLGSYVSEFITGFAAGKNDQSDKDEGVIQIRPTNLSIDRELVFDRNVYIHAKEVSTRATDLLTRPEVLFNNTNSQEQVGKTVIFDLEGDYFCSNHITRILTEDTLDAQYLSYILNLYQRNKIFFRICTNWNNQSGVGRDVLEKLLIPIPAIERQREIVRTLEANRQSAKTLFAQAQSELDAAKAAIETMILGDCV